MPRQTALDLLDAVLGRGQRLDAALEADKRFPTLAVRDRALVRNLVATSLRRLGQIDALIARRLARPLHESALRTRNALRLGVAQLLFLKVPAHAAVGETVNLVGERSHKSLVNAVLRRISVEGPELLAAQDAPRLNTPDWLWEAWSHRFGKATARAIADAHLGEPPLDLSVKADADDWAKRLGAARIMDTSLRLWPRGPVTEIAGYGDGAWWVQDAAAALPARLLGPVEGRRVIDLCAAPGGKTAQLASAGAHVTAVDASPARVRRLDDNLRRLGLKAETVVADGVTWRPPGPVDAVLLDAPCSATGTIRRHPDLVWMKTASDLAALTSLQDRLLRAAFAMVRPGGTVVYAACSLQAEEGPGRIATLRAAGIPAELIPIAPADVSGQAQLIDDAGCLRTLPCHFAKEGGVDGFFAARFRRL